MFNLILFGPPGSGKGTQSEKLIEKYGLMHLATGNILREEIANKTELGLSAKGYMDRGELVPDEVVIGMIRSAIENNPGIRGFLFDGFPRTVAQSVALDNLLAEKNARIDLLLALQVSEDELIDRLINRGKTSGRTDDVNEQIIRARIGEYENKTAPVAGHYNSSGKVVKVKGEGTIDDIFNQLSKEIDHKQGKK
ncbi:MAG: adenylate kinase [Chitinophagaceae bacterium]|nr:MAG: adenylate kinase [Chitinophagaceae bacterium]